MYQLLCLVSGVIMACVITINGSLTEWYGPYVATVIVHLVGTVVAYVGLKVTHQTSKPTEKLPLWMYLGGLFGVATTVFESVAFAWLGVTAILALSLFGQVATSLLIDGFGLFGVTKRKVSAGTLVGVLVSLCGMGYMLMGAGDMAIVAVMLSMASGICCVLNRIVNTGLSVHTSALGSSFTNHWVGLLVSIVLLYVMGDRMGVVVQVPVAPWWMYVGGICGVAMVMIWNIAGTKISAFQVTLLSFGGQVLAGVVFDLLLGKSFSKETFVGGLLVMLGVMLNMLADRKTEKECEETV